MGTDLYGPVLQKALDCAVAALADDPPGRAFIAPGLEVAHDDCCAGQVWSRLVAIQPSGRPFPTFDTAQPGPGCGVLLWAATVAIGVIRCAAVLDDEGQPPPPAALTADALRMTADAEAIREAILCCLKPQVMGLKVVGWTPTGPLGGCVGGEWSIIVAVDNCACPEEESP